MYFSGIREAYDYQSTEGWWIIYVSFPDQNFIDWMMDFPADLWISDCEKKPKGIDRDWELTILIKNPAVYLYFRNRWHTEDEYAVVRTEDTRWTLDYLLYDSEPNDEPFDDVNRPTVTFLTPQIESKKV